MKRPFIAAIVLSIGLLSSTGPAGAADLVVASGPAAQFSPLFTQPVVVVTSMDTLTYYNIDITSHDFRAYDAERGKSLEGPVTDECIAAGLKGTCPLFWTPTIGLGDSPVFGLENTPPGVYDYWCSVHPTTMKGVLVKVI